MLNANKRLHNQYVEKEIKNALVVTMATINLGNAMITVNHKEPRKLVGLLEEGTGYLIIRTIEDGYVTMNNLAVIVHTGNCSLDTMKHHDGLTPIYEGDEVTIKF